MILIAICLIEKTMKKVRVIVKEIFRVQIGTVNVRKPRVVSFELRIEKDPIWFLVIFNRDV